MKKEEFTKIHVNEDKSDWCKGPNLGRLLLTILLNDIKYVMNYCSHHCYADDAQLFKGTPPPMKFENFLNIKITKFLH